MQGEVAFRNLAIERLGAQARNEADTLPPVDERTDGVIRFPSGMEKMGEVTAKLRSTLTGIQDGEIEAPEGWIDVIV